MDSTAVNRGLGDMKGKFGAASRSMANRMRGIFRSSFLKIGAGFAAIFAGRKIYQSLEDTANWVDNIHDLATGANVAAREIVALEGAFAAAGIKMRDNGRVINEFAANLQEAIEGPSPTREGLNKLGILAPEIRPNDVLGMFKLIIGAMRDAERQGRLTDAAISGVAEDVFGSSAGFKLLKLIRNDGLLEKVTADLADLGKQVEEDGAKIAEFTDEWAIARMKMQRGLGVGILSGLGIENLVNGLNSVDWVGIGRSIGTALNGIKEFFANPEWVNVLRDHLQAIGIWFGRLIATEIGNVLKPGVFKKSAPTFESVLSEVRSPGASVGETKQVPLLEQIKRATTDTAKELKIIRREEGAATF